MKARLVVAMVMVVSANALAQEYDDMYFRSKDREKQTNSVQSTSKDAYASNYSSFKKKHFDEPTMLDEYNGGINPTDSYSARNINPEYIARSNSEQASEDEQNYFVEGYSSTINNSKNYNSGYYNNWNNNNNMSSWYSPGWFGPSYYNNFYSPYYGWNDPWMNPYCNSYGFNQGWSLSMSYFWGSGWNSGWNMGMGYNWGNPYYGGMWGPSWGMWNNPYYRPYTTVVVVGEGSRTNYGKRPTRSTAIVNDVSTRPVRTSTQHVSSNSTSGRTQSTTDEYYVRPSRRTYSNSNSSYSGYNSDGSRMLNNNTNRSYNSNSGTNNSNRSFNSNYSPSRSSSGGGFSSPSRSTSGSSGSSGSSGGSRRGGN